MSSLLDDSLVIVLAGGAGERLFPLTKDRAKPAVYFGGPYRIIDFALSNCINSGLRRIFIATQYKSLSLNRHIRMGWSVVSEELGEFIEILPPQKRIGEQWYQGTADAVYQNLYSIIRENPRYLIILSGDHVYKMDYSRMLRFHQERGAAATLAAIEEPVADASRFGIVAINEDERVTGFQEKPANPIPIPGSPDLALASMGVYIFDTDVLVRALEADANPANQPRLRQRHHSGDDSPVAGLCLPVHRREQEGSEVLARHRHARRLLRGQHGSLPRESGLQSVRSGVAAADVSAAGAAGEIRVCRIRPPLRAGARFGDLARLHHFRQHGAGQRPLPERPRAQLLSHRRLHPDAGRARRTARAYSSRDHRPRCPDSARRADRLQRGRRSPAPHGYRFRCRGRDDRR